LFADGEQVMVMTSSVELFPPTLVSGIAERLDHERVI